MRLAVVIIMDVFLEKQGYKKFDDYPGNGDNNDSFIYTRFKNPTWFN